MRSGERALCDAGPLVALFDEEDFANQTCRAALDRFEGQLVATWPVLTEAFYFLRHKPGRDRLWEFLFRGALGLEDVLSSDLTRMHSLMIKYADLPMDFADASLVVVAERLRLRTIFTLDHHFRVYRPGTRDTSRSSLDSRLQAHGTPREVEPSPLRTFS